MEATELFLRNESETDRIRQDVADALVLEVRSAAKRGFDHVVSRLDSLEDRLASAMDAGFSETSRQLSRIEDNTNPIRARELRRAARLREHWWTALRCYAADDYEEVDRHLEEIVDIAPHFPTVYDFWVQAALRFDDEETAAWAASKSVRYDRGYSTGVVSLSDVELKRFRDRLVLAIGLHETSDGERESFSKILQSLANEESNREHQRLEKEKLAIEEKKAERARIERARLQQARLETRQISERTRNLQLAAESKRYREEAQRRKEAEIAAQRERDHQAAVLSLQRRETADKKFWDAAESASSDLGQLISDLQDARKPIESLRSLWSREAMVLYVPFPLPLVSFSGWIGSLRSFLAVLATLALLGAILGALMPGGLGKGPFSGITLAAWGFLVLQLVVSIAIGLPSLVVRYFRLKAFLRTEWPHAYAEFERRRMEVVSAIPLDRFVNYSYDLSKKHLLLHKYLYMNGFVTSRPHRQLHFEDEESWNCWLSIDPLRWNKLPHPDDLEAFLQSVRTGFAWLILLIPVRILWLAATVALVNYVYGRI